MSYLKSGKSFNDIEDVDDSTFLNHPRHGSSGYILSNNSAVSLEDKRLQLLEEKRQIEQRTLQSTKNSLGLIYETEKVGLQTAEELLHQREQLNNVDEKLDSINSIMRVSQKHLTSMKSIFGGFKNYFSKGNEQAGVNKPTRLSSSTSDNRLQQTVETIRKDEGDVNSQSRHPAMRKKELPTFDEEPPSTNNYNKGNSFQQISRNVDRQLDENLSEMSMGINRLKDLALGLGTEIESQNQLLDTITSKSERAQDTISNQNRQMKRILKS